MPYALIDVKKRGVMLSTVEAWARRLYALHYRLDFRHAYRLGPGTGSTVLTMTAHVKI